MPKKLGTRISSRLVLITTWVAVVCRLLPYNISLRDGYMCVSCPPEALPALVRSSGMQPLSIFKSVLSSPELLVVHVIVSLPILSLSWRCCCCCCCCCCCSTGRMVQSWRAVKCCSLRALGKSPMEGRCQRRGSVVTR